MNIVIKCSTAYYLQGKMCKFCILLCIVEIYYICLMTILLTMPILSLYLLILSDVGNNHIYRIYKTKTLLHLNINSCKFTYQLSYTLLGTSKYLSTDRFFTSFLVFLIFFFQIFFFIHSTFNAFLLAL